MSSRNDTAKDQQIAGYHDLPEEKALREMSRLALLESVWANKSDSMKSRYFEEELIRRQLRGATKANIAGMIIGAVIGALITIIGGYLGHCR